MKVHYTLLDELEMVKDLWSNYTRDVQCPERCADCASITEWVTSALNKPNSVERTVALSYAAHAVALLEMEHENATLNSSFRQVSNAITKLYTEIQNLTQAWVRTTREVSQNLDSVSKEKLTSISVHSVRSLCKRVLKDSNIEIKEPNLN